MSHRRHMLLQVLLVAALALPAVARAGDRDHVMQRLRPDQALRASYYAKLGDKPNPDLVLIYAHGLSNGLGPMPRQVDGVFGELTRQLARRGLSFHAFAPHAMPLQANARNEFDAAGAHTMRSQMEVTEAAVDSFAANMPGARIVVVGHSMGGKTALAFARLSPYRDKILCSVALNPYVGVQQRRWSTWASGSYPGDAAALATLEQELRLRRRLASQAEKEQPRLDALERAYDAARAKESALDQQNQALEEIASAIKGLLAKVDKGKRGAAGQRPLDAQHTSRLEAFDLVAQTADGLSPIVKQAWDSASRESREATASRRTAQKSWEELRDTLRDWRRRGSEGTLRALEFDLAIACYGEQTTQSGIVHPTLVIQGKNDGAIDVPGVRRLADRQSGSTGLTLVEMDGDHWYDRAPAKFADIAEMVANFIESEGATIEPGYRSYPAQGPRHFQLGSHGFSLKWRLEPRKEPARKKASDGFERKRGSRADEPGGRLDESASGEQDVRPKTERDRTGGRGELVRQRYEDEK